MEAGDRAGGQGTDPDAIRSPGGTLDLIPLDHRARARSRLAECLQGQTIDMVEGALWIAAEEYPFIDVEREAGRVRLIAAEGASRVDGQTNPFQRLDTLRAYLFEELGFRGNHEDYNDPRNCYLNEVLDRRTGIPLTLSLIFLETARAAGFEAHGVGLPGHFVTAVRYDGRELVVDPYHGGGVISLEDCRDLVGRTTGRPSLFRKDHLLGVDDRQMLSRLLLNLKHMHLERQD